MHKPSCTREYTQTNEAAYRCTRSVTVAYLMKWIVQMLVQYWSWQDNPEIPFFWWYNLSYRFYCSSCLQTLLWLTKTSHSTRRIIKCSFTGGGRGPIKCTAGVKIMLSRKKVCKSKKHLLSKLWRTKQTKKKLIFLVGVKNISNWSETFMVLQSIPQGLHKTEKLLHL